MQPGEKRRNPRRLVSYPAFIDLGDDRPAVKCALCDASQEGAQLAVADPAALPDEFILALSSDGAARRRCRVTWRAEDSIGVQFLKDVKNGARAVRRPVAQVAPEQAPPTAPQAVEDQVDIDDLAGR
jgi:hypothetical protein